MIERRKVDEWKDGWKLLLGAMAVTSGGPLLLYTFGLFVKPLQDELGWARAQIAAGSAYSVCFTAIALFFVGRLVASIGSRRVAMFAALGFGAAAAILASIPANLLAYYAAVCLISAFSAGLTVAVTSPAVVGTFVMSRGAALGLLGCGAALILMPLSPLLQEAIARGGWRLGYLVFGAVMLIIGFAGATMLPGRRVDGVRSPSGKAEPVRGILEWVLKNPSYWVILAASVFMAAPLGGALNQLPAMLSDNGVSSPRIAAIMSAFGGAVLTGRIAVGWLLDRLPPGLLAIVVLSGAAIGSLLLIVIPQSPVGGGLAAILIGAAMGGEADFQSYFTARQFGVTVYPKIFGPVMSITALSMGFGAYLFGLVFDTTGSYNVALGLASVSLVLGALLLNSLRAQDAAALGSAA